MTMFTPSGYESRRTTTRWSMAIPPDLLEQIKAEADSRGMSRSRLASEAIRFALDHMDKDGGG